MLKLIPRVQTEGDTCGLTATAVTLDFLLNKSYSDEDIKAKYGYSLLTALNTELAGSGIKYSDIGNLDSIAKFDSIQASLDAGCPAIIGLNGERFSHSGNGPGDSGLHRLWDVGDLSHHCPRQSEALYARLG